MFRYIANYFTYPTFLCKIFILFCWNFFLSVHCYCACVKLNSGHEIPAAYAAHWETSIIDVPKLLEFAVSCCLKPADFGPDNSNQLHHFSNASEAAFGSVTYFNWLAMRTEFTVPSCLENHTLLL